MLGVVGDNERLVLSTFLWTSLLNYCTFGGTAFQIILDQREFAYYRLGFPNFVHTKSL